MPVLDDWESFSVLVARIAAQYSDTKRRLNIVAVDDGSSVGYTPDRANLAASGCIDSIEIVHLAVNLGHQRAIAVGLSLVARREDIDAVIVMDSDGEDRPEDIAMLLAAAAAQPDCVILAQRAQRSEGIGFRVGYLAYQSVFRLLTGQVIDFGNFCLLPFAAVRRLVHMPDLWNNLPAAIMRSRLRSLSVPTARGMRHAGRSHMNLAALIIHGLSAMSVYSDLIFVRVLLAATLCGGVTLVGIISVVAVRIMTTLAIPGWATTAFGDLTIILLQTVVIVIATTLMMLSTRSQRPIVPLVDAPTFVVDRQLLTLAETCPKVGVLC